MSGKDLLVNVRTRCIVLSLSLIRGQRFERKKNNGQEPGFLWEMNEKCKKDLEKFVETT